MGCMGMKSAGGAGQAAKDVRQGLKPGGFLGRDRHD
jgi:hypothetical protein